MKFGFISKFGALAILVGELGGVVGRLLVRDSSLCAYLSSFIDFCEFFSLFGFLQLLSSQQCGCSCVFLLQPPPPFSPQHEPLACECLWVSSLEVSQQLPSVDFECLWLSPIDFSATQLLSSQQLPPECFSCACVSPPEAFTPLHELSLQQLLAASWSFPFSGGLPHFF